MSTTSTAEPTDLPSCIDLLAFVNASIDALGTTDDQAWTFGYNNDAVDYILACVVTLVFIVLLFDRIIGQLTDNSTAYAANAKYSVPADEVPYFFDGVGLWIYYYGRSLFAAVNQFAIIYLLYLQIRDAVRRISGRPWMNLCLALTMLVLPVELLKQLFGIVKLHITGNDDDLYPPVLIWTTTAYRVALDLAFTFYSFRIIHRASSGDKNSHGRHMADHTAFLVGYLFRVLLFLAVDGLFIVVTQMDIAYNDPRFSSLTLWGCARVLLVIKPFLICTDMARVRALSAGGETTSDSSPGATKAMSTDKSASAPGFDELSKTRHVSTKIMDDPTDLSSCIAAVIYANDTLTNSTGDLDDQSANYGYNSDSINWIPVVSSILFEILNVVGNAIPWFFTIGGDIIYFYGRAIFASTNQWAVCYLLYLRVSDALKRRFDRKIAMIAFCLTAAVLPLELAKQGYGAILWSVTLDADQPLYLEWLNNLSAAYRSALDLLLSGYSFWVIHTAASGDRSGHHRGRLMREDTAFLVGYATRVLLFVGVDILFVITTCFSSAEDDMSFEGMSLWACAQLMSPIRPYLIVTDMARIRALSAESPDEAPTSDLKVK
ncbi:hypothetical protein HDU87_003483 [Geranomyces variabilis]|uniref:Uncharacterized protein n=1 Tax=Geranomyces variabilis TaxID=109894 RepID=A0AAD5TK31_9FUNG|nr:hypothetical protein HDU87_003483 [Geranomyces variabilis]